MITVQILTRNNAGTIKKALDSLYSLDARVVVGDIGSSDDTLDICSGYGAEIKKIPWGMDYSKARNVLIDPGGMNMLLEPWEFVAKGHEEINSCSGNSSMTVVRGSSASKEFRIWKGLRFKYPVHEVLDGESVDLLGEAALVAGALPDRREETYKICSAWRESRPTSLEPWYYSAFAALSLGKRDEFLSHAERYMAMTGDFGPPEVQVAYRMAQVLAAKGQSKIAAGWAVRCLAAHPTFAEFWCLLGDLFMGQKQYGKAASMYKNAMAIGCRRRRADSHPVEIDKYGKYPEKMIDYIEGMDKRTEMIVRAGG